MNDTPLTWNREILRGNGTEKIITLQIEGTVNNIPSSTDDFNKSKFIAQINHVAQDPEVVALIIYLNSTGGNIATIEEMYRQLSVYKKTGKHLILSIGANSTNFTYLIAPLADYIFALHTSEIGNFFPSNVNYLHPQYKDFLIAIEKGRGLTRSQVIQISNEGIFSGHQALRIGLIDQLGSWHDAINWTIQKLQVDRPIVIHYKN